MSARRDNGRLAGTRERGAAAVELALLLPTFIFMMVATEEVGRALYEYNTVTKSVRGAAQYLARYGVLGTGVFAPTSAQETTARNIVLYGSPATGSSTLVHGMSATDVTIAYRAVAPSAVNNAVQITAAFNFEPIAGFGAFLDGLDLPTRFSASIEMAATK